MDLTTTCGRAWQIVATLGRQPSQKASTANSDDPVLAASATDRPWASQISMKHVRDLGRYRPVQSRDGGVSEADAKYCGEADA